MTVLPDSIPPSIPPLSDPPRQAVRTSKRRPQARLRSSGGGQEVADWASLFGDLGRSASPNAADDPPVEWRVHDRTHLEFAIDYPMPTKGSRSEHTWEAFFFLPESFRLHEDSYDKKAIYDDLWSYVRYAVPQLPFYQLAERRAGGPLARAREALTASAGAEDGSEASALAMRRLRFYACLVRAAGVSSMREIEREIQSPEPSAAQLRALVGPFVATCSAVAGALRALIDETASLAIPEEARIAARWTDEDVSMVLETLCATLGIAVENRAKAVPALRGYAEPLAAHAVEQARHRRDRGYGSLGSADASERDIEHLEFRRHVLKRFTSSVLWLSLEVHEAAAWVVHTLYAFAAAVAMAFALAAGFRATPMTESFFRYAVVVVIAYAVKDRLKAFLQSVFAGWIARRFPDRKWSILDRERGRRVGRVHERAAFLPFASLPEEVLRKRRSTREHPLEEHARPERVLWHHKTVSVSRQKSTGNVDFPMMTEIFRLNLRRWLSHTDDPNRKIVFADPRDARVYSATARRVYNVNVVYRLSASGVDSPWHRLRMVVSRKGIERIDAIC